MAFLIGGANSLTAAYDVENSCRIETGTDVGVYYTPGENGAGAGKKFTFSCWVKRSVLGANSIMVAAGTDSGDDDDTCFRFTSADLLQLTNFAGGAATLYSTTTTAKFRDVSAWYHCVASVDTADGTEANRVKLYVNGEYISGVTGDYPAQNHVYKYCMQHMQVVGGRPDADPNDGTIQCTGGYLAEVMMVDNQQLAASSFGESDEDSGIWKPKDISGIDVGTNGFYLEFKQTGTGTAGTTTIGADTSGETNHLTSLNLAATVITTDTPTNNFATMNSLDNYYQGSTFSEGNCHIVTGSASTTYNTSTMGMTNGKWYAEATPLVGAATSQIGIISKMTVAANATMLAHAEGWGYEDDGDFWGAASQDSSYGDSYANNDIVGIAVDLTNNKLYFSKNGTWQNSGDPTSGATGTGAKSITDPASTTAGAYFFCFNETWADNYRSWSWNFGNPIAALSSGNADANGYGNFEYAPPSGYYSLCTKNLAEFG